MSTAEIAKDFIGLCQQGKNMEAIARYYADNIVSVESTSGPDMPAEMKGIDAIRGKNQWWFDNHEINSAQANGPYVGEDKFAAEFIYDVTHKTSGKRMQMQEMALYTVEGGKIVHEHFFYNAGG
ncbi:MAG: SnoaL-like domain-containing protein [Acidobacteriaceae bacterium]